MNKDKLDDNGFHRLPPWQDALGRYLKRDPVIPGDAK